MVNDKRKSSSLLLTVLNSIDALVYVVDMETYDLLFVNDYGIKTWGAIIGQKCYTALQKGQAGPCDFCTNHLLIDESGAPTGIVQWEFKNQKNGRWYDCRDIAIEWADNRLARLEIATDITSRKHLEESLQKREEAYRRLADDLPLLICSFGPDMKITYANKEYCAFFGRELEDLLGSSFLHLIPQEDRELVKATIASLAPSSPIKRQEHQVLSKDGHLCWQHWTNRAFFNDGDEVISYHSVGEDITDRKRAEEALCFQLAFERALSQLSALFVNLPLESFDEGIREALELVGEFFYVDRVYLSVLSPNGDWMSVNHEWRAEGVESLPNLESIPVEKDSWWFKELQSFRTIYTSTLEGMTPETRSDKNFFFGPSIVTFLAIPIIEESKLLGWMALETVKERKIWAEEHLSLLKIAVEIISSALTKNWAERELVEQERLQQFLMVLAKDFINISLREGRWSYRKDARDYGRAHRSRWYLLV